MHVIGPRACVWSTRRQALTPGLAWSRVEEAGGGDVVARACRGTHARQRRVLLVHGEGPAAALDGCVRPAPGWQPGLGSVAGTARTQHAAVAGVSAPGRVASATAGHAPLGRRSRFRAVVARSPVRGRTPEDAGDGP